MHYKVCVWCDTYNQSHYIFETLDGFCNQSTDFPYVCIIIDDASTDGEQAVIQNYLDANFDDCINEKSCNDLETEDYRRQVKVHKKNRNCTFVVFFLKYNHYQIGKTKDNYRRAWIDRSDFVALCEGDDYWIDKDKLNKQVAYFESNPGCSLVHTRFLYWTEANSEFESDMTAHMRNLSIINNKEDVSNCILRYNDYRIQTCTAMMRTMNYKQIQHIRDAEEALSLMGGTQLWMNLASLGEIGYLQDVTSVYRVMKESACRSNDPCLTARFAVSCAEMRLVYATRFHKSLFAFYKDYVIWLRQLRKYQPSYNTNPRIWNLECNKLLFKFLFNKYFLLFSTLFFLIKGKFAFYLERFYDIKSNFVYYIALPFFMGVPSRFFRRFVLRRLGAKIGKKTHVSRFVSFRDCKNIEIGEGCVINPHVLLDGRGAKIRIGANVDIAQETTIWTMSHDKHTHEAYAKDVIINDYAWICNRVIIMPGVEIGKDSICAAGAVVSKDVPPNSIVGGVPARVLGCRNRTRDYKLSFSSIFR